MNGTTTDNQRTNLSETGRGTAAYFAQITGNSRFLFQTLVEKSLAGIFVLEQGKIVYVNQRMTQILGYDQKELLHRNSILLYLAGDHREAVYQQWLNTGDNDPVLSNQVYMQCKDSTIIPVDTMVMCTNTGDKRCLIGMMLDASDKQRTLEKQRLTDQVLECAMEGIVVTDRYGSIDQVNPAFTRITGYSAEQALGNNPRMLKSDRHNAAFYDKMWAEIRKTGQWRGEIWNRRCNGEAYPEHLVISAIYNECGEVSRYIGVFNDITEQKRSEEHIRHQTYHDALTDLPNRFLFYDRLGLAIAHAHRSSSMVAIMFLDLDRFKVINDTLGHAIGDLLLQEAATRLGQCVREGDTVSRLGGDEFTIILENLTQMHDVDKVAQQILHDISQPFRLSGHEVYITPSIGISLYPNDGKDIDTLVKNADTAMYRAKEQGRNNYQLYAPSMNAEALARLVMENDLRRALEKRRLILHYQPRVDAKTGKIVSAEALVRWNHDDLGLVAPAKFIPLAEETGLIVPLGTWVLREACRQVKKWHDAGYSNMQVSVNISPCQFQQGTLVDMVTMVLHETGLPACCLELEITESTSMKNAELTIDILRRLTAMGVQISIDDFGTGYSSLSYLKKFSLDTVKIDQSFVRDIANDPDDASIVTAVGALAHALNLQVVAEGVETAEQLVFLQQHDCDQIQGYFFSRPLDANEFEKLLACGHVYLIKRRQDIASAVQK